MVLPPYLVSIGFGSKLSTWLTPPFMNSQMTLLALGGKCGRPSGGDHSPSRPQPSRCSMAPRAREAKPDRTARRVGTKPFGVSRGSNISGELPHAHDAARRAHRTVTKSL